MSNLKLETMTPERRLRYYHMVVRLCGGKQENAPLLYKASLANWRRRQDKREKLGYPGETLAELWFRQMLDSFGKYGLDYDRVNRSLNLMFGKCCKRYDRAVTKMKDGKAKQQASQNNIKSLQEWMDATGIVPGVTSVAEAVARANGPAPMGVRFKTKQDEDPEYNTLWTGKQAGRWPIVDIRFYDGTRRAEVFWRGLLWAMEAVKNQQTA